jgi:predicted AlkP superfamily phosphohydrolase/phosphomutase
LPQLLVLGLDCLDPILLQKWIEKGCLPTFKKLVKNGVFGRLESTIPPTTIPAWPALFTGKNPGKLGVFDFFDINKEDGEYRATPFSPATLQGHYVWDLLENVGVSTGIINFPELFSFYEINGFFVSNRRGPLLASPSKLERELKATFPEVLNPFDSLEAFERNTLIEWQINKYLRKRFDVDLLIHVIHLLDYAVHQANNEGDLRTCYEHVDKQLGEYLSSEQNDNVLIVSDHGSRKYSKKFYVNTYLKQQGYLQLKQTHSSTNLLRSLFYRLVNNSPSLEKRLKKYANIFTRVTGQQLSPSLNELFNSVDWSSSKAFAYALQTSNYVGIWNVTEDEKILEQISALEYPNSHSKIVKRIFTKEEVYQGQHLTKLPDVVLQLAEDCLATSELGPIPYCNTHNYAHQRYGSFIAYGNDFMENVSLNNAKIYDVAPTILHIMGAPISSEMDGRVLTEIFRKESHLAKDEVKIQKPTIRETKQIVRRIDEDDLKKRLESLGYL